MVLDILVGTVLMLCMVISSVALMPPPRRHGHHRAAFHRPHFHRPHFHWPHFH